VQPTLLQSHFQHLTLKGTVERLLTPEAKAERQQSVRNRSGRPIVTNDPLMIRVLEVAEAVARSEATVLIQGEFRNRQGAHRSIRPRE